MSLPSDRQRNRYDPATGRLEVSEILVAEGRAPIAHLEYDWLLNDARQ